MTYEQALKKYYYSDVFKLQPPKDFNKRDLEDLSYPEKLTYLRKHIPREYVIKFQIELAKSLTTKEYTKAPERIGRREIRGDVYVEQAQNPKNSEEKSKGEVAFVDEGTNN